MENNKLIECVACGNLIGYYSNRCPKCGDISNSFKNKKRVFIKTLKYGFYTFMVVIILLIIFA